MICDLLADTDSEWVKDTLDWWNMWVFFMIHYTLKKYSHRQVFGSLPRNVDDEDLVNSQISSLNILKAQRAHKLKAANTASTRHARKDHGKTTVESAQHSSIPETTGPSQSPLPPETSEDRRDFDEDWGLDIFEEEQLRESSPILTTEPLQMMIIVFQGRFKLCLDTVLTLLQTEVLPPLLIHLF
jgi:hypothetical protein